ncbi:MAG: prolipoprotein diacylglyceryl transferase [Myxococcota bacterium]
MHPVLLDLPFINQPIHSYGALIVIGFLLALQVAKWRCQRLGKYELDALDFGFWALVGGLIGARLVFIAVEWQDYFVHTPYTKIHSLGIEIPSVFAFWQGGLVYWGGFLGGFIACIIFTLVRKLPSLHFFDIMVVGVPLAQIFGRLGCVAAGCCYGQPLATEHSVGILFPPGSAAFDTLVGSSSGDVKNYMIEHAHTWPLFPSQLVEAFGALVIYGLLVLLSERKQFHGQVLLAYAVLYSVMRSCLELFRGDAARGYMFNGLLTTSQFISLCVVVIAVLTSAIMTYRHKKNLSFNR